MLRKRAAYAIGELIPGLPMFNGGKTYAAWRVWRDSTTRSVNYRPLPKKQAARIWHKARAFDRATHERGRHGGAIGRTALAVLHALLFEFLNYRTGQLDPSYEGIAQRSGVSRRAVATALQRLKALGMLHWLRRAQEGRDAAGRFTLQQETNAYAVLPPSQWRGYREPPEPAMHPTEWGAVPPLPALIEQARSAQAEGDNVVNILPRLTADPRDKLAAALASLFSTVTEREAMLSPECTPCKEPIPKLYLQAQTTVQT